MAKKKLLPAWIRYMLQKLQLTIFHDKGKSINIRKDTVF
jgi:hypothetical protein